MNEIFEKIYNDNNTNLNEDIALFEKVYTEAEMLNEMNPKLRALLAAGLIGTASLGAASCSMLTDDPTGGEEHVETAEERLQRLQNEFNAILIDLNVTEEHIAKLALSRNHESETGFVFVDEVTNYVYTGRTEGFIEVTEDTISDYSYGDNAIRYYSGRVVYHIPEAVDSQFFGGSGAVAVYNAYKAAQVDVQ